MSVSEVVTEDIQAAARAVAKEATALEGRTVLITGGCGFLGSYIVGTLLHLNQHGLRSPCKVIILDNFITGMRENVIFDMRDPNVTFVECDVSKELPEGILADYVMHAAGIASPVYYRKYPIETINVAVDGTRNLLTYANQRKVLGFLYFSSSEIYGDPDPRCVPTPETYWGNVSSMGPRSCYDESKRLGETLCATYHMFYGTPVRIVRPFNVFGPGMKKDDYRVIPTFLMAGMAKRPLPVHDKGNQTRTFCYVSDAVAGILKVLLSGKAGEVYNVGNDDEEINVVSLANMVSGLFPDPVPVQLTQYPDAYPAGEPMRRCPDLTKIRRELGYEPKVNLETGLGRTLRWFRSFGAG
jgi:UDP-glucuronate decarboxylase